MERGPAVSCSRASAMPCPVPCPLPPPPHPPVLRKPRGRLPPLRACVLQGSRKSQARLGPPQQAVDCKRQAGSTVGISLSLGRTCWRKQAGAIGESGGHGWLTTSRKAVAGQTSDSEGLRPLPQASPSSLQQARLAQEPRDSVVCLAVGSGATPLGKEGSLHGPEAIKQDVGQ